MHRLPTEVPAADGAATELVEQGGADINDSVQAQTGHRPQFED